MVKTIREVAGFVALPVIFKTVVYPESAKHFIYLKPHEPQIPDEDAARSLFLVNIPISTAEAHIRHLFATQLQAGRVEQVSFPENGTTNSSALIATSKPNKKRKRQTVEEMEAALDTHCLPHTYPSQLHRSGSTAIVKFVDRPSMESSLKAARRATRSNTEIIWGAGIESKLPLTGLKRYEAHKSLQYPPQADLLRVVDKYMTAFSELETARSAENARKRAAPDEDGFVTVTRGSKGGVLRKEEADELKKMKKEKEGLEDFYRFQMREKRKEKQGEMLRQFEEDKRKVVEMRRRRGVPKPED